MKRERHQTEREKERDREMAQVARHRLTALLRNQRGPFTHKSPVLSNRSFSASAAKHENIEETRKWQKITVAGYVLCGSLTIYNLVGDGHHGGEKPPEYSYLHIRNKEFPWGPDGLFEAPKHEH